MVLVRVMQRKDAASLVVAVAAGLAVFSFLSTFTAHLTSLLSGGEGDYGFADSYWRPVVALVLQLVLLELLARVVIAAYSSVKK